MPEYKVFCIKSYNSIYAKELSSSLIRNKDQKERFAQKKAIRDTLIQALNNYPAVEASEIWKIIYSEHVRRRSGVGGVTDPVQIAAVISADNSWKKSSGHAFEEMVKVITENALLKYDIKLFLQKELGELLKNNEIENEKPDIETLKPLIRYSIFDLYACIVRDKKIKVYGCIQTKTSIRDRVTRDREPSVRVMGSFFWSVAIVLDGSFLNLRKFQSMVNGGSADYPDNGWHAMYVLSPKICNDRIYPISSDFKLFIEDAKKAADYWTQQRQWLNSTWRTVQYDQSDLNSGNDRKVADRGNNYGNKKNNPKN